MAFNELGQKGLFWSGAYGSLYQNGRVSWTDYRRRRNRIYGRGPGPLSLF